MPPPPTLRMYGGWVLSLQGRGTFHRVERTSHQHRLVVLPSHSNRKWVVARTVRQTADQGLGWWPIVIEVAASALAVAIAVVVHDKYITEAQAAVHSAGG